MKKLFFSMLFLLVLLIGAVFLLPMVLSSDTARTQLSKRISTLSGMQIALKGPVSFSVFPDFGLVASSVELASPDQDFSIAVRKIIAGVNLTSVLSGNLEITGFSLIQPVFIVDATKRPQTTPTEPSDNTNNTDPFASAVDLLEKLSLIRFEISKGHFTSISTDGSNTAISDINLVLLAPSLDGEIKLDFNAIKDGQQISSTARLAALRPILKRQPSQVDITLQMAPPPHPALADLKISGNILLGEDGSYQISNGAMTSLGQPLRLDMLYQPGKRPYAKLDIAAQNVDFGLIEQISNSNDQQPQANGSKPDTSSGNNAPAKNRQKAAAPDLGPLLEMDADISIVIDRFSMDGAEIRKINLTAKLENGNLDIDLGNAEIADGTIAVKVTARLGEPQPSIQGSLSAVSLGIGSLAKLANAKVPLTGSLGLNIGYAFRGLDPGSIKNSFNVAGTVSLSNGVASIPALGELGLGAAAANISAMNIVANIQNAQKPVDIKARMKWNGETIELSSLITPHNFLKSGSGPVVFSVKSNQLTASYSGNVSLNGAINGAAKISTRSLGNTLAWLGQGKNAQLKGFSYSGNINLDSNKFKFNKSKISLNGIAANGSGSLGLKGKPSINTTLAFDTLDIAALSGGGSASTGTPSSGSSDSAIDLSALNKFDANIKLSARKILYGKVVAGPLKTTLVIKNGVAKFKLPQTPFYNGSILADITADGSNKVAAISADAKLAGIDALPLFQDAADFTKLEGKLNAGLSIRGQGATTRQFTKSLTGNTDTRFADGAIRGIDIAKIYNNLSAILTGGFKENSKDKTTFTELGLSFVIDKGVATTTDIKLQGPLVRMDGGGNIDLGEETIDMRLNPRVVASASGQGGNYDVSGLGIPVIIKGPLSKPRVYPDLSELIKNPQAALQSLSKLGLNIKGLDLKKLGKGKLDIAKIAKDNLGLDKLDKIAGKGTAKTVGKVIGGLLTKNKSSGKDGTGNVVGALLNQLVKPKEPEAAAPDAGQPIAPQQPEEDIVLNITGRIPVPTANPRRKAAIAEAPKTTKQAVIEKIAPKIKLPVSDKVKKKGLNLIFDGLLNNN